MNIVASGNCGAEGDGSNLTWTLDENGLLIVSGSGAMGNCDDPNDVNKVLWTDEGVSLAGSITRVVLPDGLTSIGMYAFAQCTQLAEVTIPDGVTSIGMYAFTQCAQLAEVTISAGVTDIGNGAFYDTGSLTGFLVSPENPKFCDVDGVLYNKDQTVLVDYPEGRDKTSYAVPEGVTVIGYLAFAACQQLKTVELPNSLTGISDYAFFCCYGLESLRIPDTLKQIGGGAFDYCPPIKNVYYTGEEAGWNSMAEGIESLANAKLWCVGPGSGSVLGAELTETGAEATVYCRSGEPQAVYAARYDSQGRFLGVEIIPLDSGTVNTVAVTCGAGEKVRLMVLDAATLSPVCGAEERTAG